MKKESISSFRTKVNRFYRRAGRNLPWRETLDPYKILVSEIMLQQTQVDRVVPFYRKFVKLFPDFYTLSRAGDRKILLAWQGLGYNRRALYLKRIAKVVVKHHKGKLPRDERDLLKLPGVGKGTAGSLQAFAFNMPSVFLETNIRRAFIHHFFPASQKVSDDDILPLVASALDKRNPRQWYSALMDYGTMIATKHPNPNRRAKNYAVQAPFSGSRREMRGKILKLLLKRPKADVKTLARATNLPLGAVRDVFAVLKKEGFVKV